VSIGDTLAAARRQADLTVTQVSQRTCIRETIVRGIERGDYSACGGDFYARGHIRSIARAVGLDPEELIREYDAQALPRQITAADVFQPFTPVKLKERRRPNWSVVLAVGVVAVLGVVGYRYLGSHPSNQNTQQPPTAQPDRKNKTPDVTHSAAPPAAAPTRVHVTVVATHGKVTWLELTSFTGRVVYQGDIGASGGVLQKSWTEEHIVKLQFGNPGGATLYLDGKKQSFSETTKPITVQCSPIVCTTTRVG